MDSNSGRQDPDEAESSNQPQQQQQPSMDHMNENGGDDWRLEVRTESRQRIVKNLIWYLSCNLPVPDLEAYLELKKIAVRIEEKIYTAATSLSDYFLKVSFKMVAARTRSCNQNNMASLLPFNSVGNRRIPQNPGNSGLQNNLHSLHMLRQSKFPSQQTQQIASNMVKTQGQQPQQLMMPVQLQSQLPLQQSLQQKRQNPLHRVAQQRLQTSHATLRLHKMAHQQKQLSQYQRNLPEEPSTSLNSTSRTNNAAGGEWHEEVYQKIKTMKDLYFPELEETYQKIAARLQEIDSLPHQPKSEQLEKLKLFKKMLERILTYLQVPKNNITSAHEEKFGAYERQIISFLNANRRRKPVPSVQQGQFLPVTSAFGAAVAAGTTSKCSTHMLRQSKFPSQQTQQNASNMDPRQGNASSSLLHHNPASVPNHTTTMDTSSSC